MNVNSDEDEVDTDSEKRTEPPTKKKRYDTKFQKCQHLTDENLKDWVEERDNAPYCKVCKTRLSCAKTALVRHKDSSTHKKQQKTVSSLHQSHPTITSMFASQTKPARIEIKLCVFIAENNLPISLTQDLVALLKSLFPSEGSLKNVKLGKQKATNVIRQVLGFYSIKEVITKLKANPFSLIIDETTDRSTKTQLAVLGTYFDEENFKLDTFLIDLITLPNGTATTIYESVIKCMNDKFIPMENVIGFSSDTCNVMFGKNHSVAQMLVKDYPWIMAVKCSCHMIHLCSSYACKKLPKSLEDLCRNIYSHFGISPKSTEAFIEFQEFFNLEKHKILKVSQTRWLSMKGAVKRILEQYSALKLYFTSEVMEDPTHTNESILKSLNNKFTQAYLEFMDYSLGRFASFNLLFQSETPLLHRLKDEVERLMLYTRSVSALKIDPNNEGHQVPLNKVYLGVAATETIRDIKGDLESRGLTSHEDIQLFRSHCTDFLIQAVIQIQDRFGNCQNMDHLSCLSPIVAFNLEIPSLNSLYKEMPHLERVADLQSVDQEWGEHVLNPKLGENQTPEEY
jgi:hypothetical protein